MHVPALRSRLLSLVGLACLASSPAARADHPGQRHRMPYVANIFIAGGISNEKKFLSVPADGAKVDLWNADDNSGRQKWAIQRSVDGETYNLLIDGGVTPGERKFLSTTDDGSKVDLYDKDDGSGRQRWIVEPAGEEQVHIRISGGVKGERRFLSVASDGSKVDLFDKDDGSGRQKWRIAGLRDRAPRWSEGVANIQILGGIKNARHFLSTTSDGSKVDLYDKDDSSGRQKWHFQRSPDGETFNILVGSGVKGARRFLSVTSDGSKVDLYDKDDGSGRQRWEIEPIGFDFVRIQVAGGISNERHFLSTSDDGAKVDLYDKDDASGRQRWKITR